MAGRIPQQFIDDLMMRVDIVDVIDARVPLKKAGKNYLACCPFHEEKTPSFTVSQEKQFFHCFGCGAHGTAIGFLMDYEHLEFPEAVTELAARVGMTVPVAEGTGENARNDGPDLYGVLSRADQYFRRQLREHPQAQRAVTYLKGRGLSGQIAADFGIGYAPEGWDNLLKALGSSEEDRRALLAAGLIIKKEQDGYYDRFRGRIMFPIHDSRGRVAAFGGRVLDKGEPKYLNSPETPVFHKGKELYGLYPGREAIRKAQRALVVEGYMDVVALAQFSIRYAVATLGTATTPFHLERVFRFAPEVVFCFDGDAAGRAAAWRALENTLPALHEGRQVSFLFLPEGEDPDTLVRKEGAEAFEKRLAQATPLPEFLFDHLKQQVDLGRMDGRARLAELARPLIAKLPDGIFRRMMVDRLAELTGLDSGAMGGLLGPARENGRRLRPVRKPAAEGRTSLVRTAIMLLVQHPELGQHAGPAAELAELEAPGVGLLRDLLDLIHDQPGLNTGALLERYRGSEHGPHLEKLAAREHMIQDQDLGRVFSDTLCRLQTMTLDQMTDSLLAKPELSSEEKQRLLEIYQQKQELQAQLARH